MANSPSNGSRSTATPTPDSVHGGTPTHPAFTAANHNLMRHQQHQQLSTSSSSSPPSSSSSSSLTPASTSTSHVPNIAAQPPLFAPSSTPSSAYASTSRSTDSRSLLTAPGLPQPQPHNTPPSSYQSIPPLLQPPSSSSSSSRLHPHASHIQHLRPQSRTPPPRYSTDGATIPIATTPQPSTVSPRVPFVSASSQEHIVFPPTRLASQHQHNNYSSSSNQHLGTPRRAHHTASSSSSSRSTPRRLQTSANSTSDDEDSDHCLTFRPQSREARDSRHRHTRSDGPGRSSATFITMTSQPSHFSRPPPPISRPSSRASIEHEAAYANDAIYNAGNEPGSSGSASSNRNVGSMFDPLLQQLTDVKFPKDKVSLDLTPAQSSVGLSGLGPENPIPYRSTTPITLPDRRGNRTPGVVSVDGDGSMESGPSAASQWGDALDYNSAFENDAAIPMAGVATHGKEGAAGFDEDDDDYMAYAARRKSGLGGLWASDSADTPLMESGLHSQKTNKWGLKSWLSPSAWKASASRSNSNNSSRYAPLYSGGSSKSPLMRGQPQYRNSTSSYDHRFKMSMLLSPPRLLCWAATTSLDFIYSYHPLTLLLALAFVAGFVASTTLLIIYILNPDKEPLAWRTDCASAAAFPHDLADSLAPVDIVIGVMTTDVKADRRAVIRQTYAGFTQPMDPMTGLPTSNIQVKFILGKPRKALEHAVALEMEMYNDIVILDQKETQYKGKSWKFFEWASENATFPILRPRDQTAASTQMQTRMPGVLVTPDGEAYDVAWKKADYVIKADDDTFIVLDELERHLRVAPRKLTYWGYLIKGWFMGGEAYALSMDLIEWIATSPWVRAHANGKEDTLTAYWLEHHPNASQVNYVSERCWIYDHPKSGSPYAHGYLFPDEVQRIKWEEKHGLPAREVSRRGGEHASKWYSTVSKWHATYHEPAKDLTVEEMLEALIEGGGLWKESNYRKPQSFAASDQNKWYEWSDRVFDADDRRLKSDHFHRESDGLKEVPARLRADWRMDELSSLPIYAPANSSLARETPSGNLSTLSTLRGRGLSKKPTRLIDDARDAGDDDDDDDGHPPHVLDSLPLVGALKHLAGSEDDARAQAHGAKGAIAHAAETSTRSPLPESPEDESSSSARRPPKRVPAAESADYYSVDRGLIDLQALREARYLLGPNGKPLAASTSSSGGSLASQPFSHQAVLSTALTRSLEGRASPAPVLRGGTIIVHYLKRHELFFETALALIGRDRLRRGLAMGGYGLGGHGGATSSSSLSQAADLAAKAAPASALASSAPSHLSDNDDAADAASADHVRTSYGAGNGNARGSEWRMWGSSPRQGRPS